MDILISILLIAAYVLFVVIAPLAICVILLAILSWQLSRSKNSQRRSLLLLGIITVLAILSFIIWLDLHVSS